MVIAVALAGVADGLVRWALLGFGIGATVGLLLVVPGPLTRRWPGIALPLLLLAVYGSSPLWTPVPISSAMLIGVAVGWFAVGRSFPADEPLRPVDATAAVLAVAIVGLTQWRTAGTVASSLLVAAALLWLVATVWIVAGGVRHALRRFARGGRLGPSPVRPRMAATYRWFLLACLCVLATLLVGSRDVGRITDDDLRFRVAAINDARHGVPSTTVSVLRKGDSAARDDMLIRTFAPRLFLPSKKAAWPHHPWVDILESEVIDLAHDGVHTRPRFTTDERSWVPRSCRYPDGQRCVITNKCFSNDRRCGAAIGDMEWPYGIYVPPGGDFEHNYLRPYGVLYARMLHRGGDSFSDSRRQTAAAFAGVERVDARFGERLTDLVQYWIYYRYDSWRAATALGVLVQEHESDWEPVTVGLSDGKPLFVAYGAHCGGQWLDWKRVPAVMNGEPETFILSRHAQLFPNSKAAYLGLLKAGRTERTHPAVMVAAGSQGNYPASAHFRVSDWTSCTKLGRSFGDVISAAVSLHETLELGQEVVPAEIFGTFRGQLPMSFGGHWGENSRISIAGWTISGGEDTPGPPAPLRQKIWTKPLVQIFHSPVWHEGADP